MDRRDEAEPTVVERPQRRVEKGGPRVREEGPNRRILVVALILSVIAFAALAVTVLNAGEGPVEATDSPEPVDAVEPGTGTPIDLAEGNRSAIVLVEAQDETCWRGYIGSETIEGCGTQQFDVSGSPKLLGANVRHDNTERAFIGLTIWDAAGEETLAFDTTRKPLGLVSLSTYPPK